MAKHSISIPKKVTGFFEDLEDAERGMAYSILLKYIETGVMPSLDGKPSAVKIAIRYAVEKMQRSIARRFAVPQPESDTATEISRQTDEEPHISQEINKPCPGQNSRETIKTYDSPAGRRCMAVRGD